MSKRSDSERIPLARPSLSDAERSAAIRVLSGTQLTGGPERERFEALLADRCKRPHALAVSNGTAALELALWSLGVEAGDRVLVTAFGFPAAANVVAARGAIPVPVDVCADTWCMDMDLVRELCDENVQAIVSIDQLGVVTRGRDLRELEEATGLPVISDAACGLGGLDQDGEPAGSAGAMATLSFHPRKVITTGEGGAVVSSDDALADRLYELRNHGQACDGGFARIGTNARLDEVSCAIGCAQLRRLNVMLNERNMLADGYRDRLGDLVGAEKIVLQKVPVGARPSYQSFSLLLAEGIERPKVLQHMWDAGVDGGIATYSFPELATHALPEGSRAAPVAKALHERAISIPFYLGMRSAQLDRVCAALKQAVEAAAT